MLGYNKGYERVLDDYIFVAVGGLVVGKRDATPVGTIERV